MMDVCYGLGYSMAVRALSVNERKRNSCSANQLRPILFFKNVFFIVFFLFVC